MSTKALLDRLVPRASSGWSRSTGNRSLIKLIERGQDQLINTLGPKRVWRGTDNKGWPPYLKTVAGTSTYEIKGANLSSGAITLSLNGTSYTVLADIVRRIFLDVTSGGYDDTVAWMSEPAFYADLNPYSTVTERLVVSEIAVDAMPAMGNANPTVTFPFDPGTQNTKWMVEFYWRAPRLTSEAIPLVVPDEMEDAIEDYVIGKIQESENGAPSNLIARFEQFWKIEFPKKFNVSAKMNSNKVIPRFC